MRREGERKRGKAPVAPNTRLEEERENTDSKERKRKEEKREDTD